MTNDDQTNTEKRTIDLGPAIGAIFALLFDAALFFVFTYNAYLILQKTYDFTTIVFCACGFFAVLGESIRRAIVSGFKSIGARAERHDTPGDSQG